MRASGQSWLYPCAEACRQAAVHRRRASHKSNPKQNVSGRSVLEKGGRHIRRARSDKRRDYSGLYGRQWCRGCQRPADVYFTLARTGTIKTSDIIGEQTYVLADGSTHQQTTFMIRSLKLGDQVVENVRGSVASFQGRCYLAKASWNVLSRGLSRKLRTLVEQGDRRGKLATQVRRVETQPRALSAQMKATK